MWSAVTFDWFSLQFFYSPFVTRWVITHMELISVSFLVCTLNLIACLKLEQRSTFRITTFSITTVNLQLRINIKNMYLVYYPSIHLIGPFFQSQDFKFELNLQQLRLPIYFFTSHISNSWLCMWNLSQIISFANIYFSMSINVIV